MRSLALRSGLALALAAAAHAQTTLFVDAGALPGGDGSSWASAFDDLHAALAVASSGDTLWVAEGLYPGGGSVFVMPAGVTLLGGFPSGASRIELRSPSAHPSILDGGGAKRVVRIGMPGIAIDGFTLQNGSADGSGGGGALVDGEAPVLRNLIFTGNTNTAGRGSALAVKSGGDPLVENCVFYKNGDPSAGHVIDVLSSNGTYRHLTVYDNFENGFHIQSGSAPVIENSLFALNSGRGICVISASDAPTIGSSHFWNNGVSHMHVTGSELTTIGQVNALAYASNNVTGDPLFANGAGGDLRPTASSPLVDAGSATVPAVATTDPDGFPRRLDGDLDGVERVDIGAFEFAHVELDVVGISAPGSTLQIAAQGTPGMAVEVWVGAKWTALADPPFGTMFFDPKIRRRRIGLGQTPLSMNFKLPGSLPSGLDLVYQARAFDPTLTRGNWSNGVYTELQ